MNKGMINKYLNEIKYFNLQDLRWDNIEQWPTLMRWVAPVLLFLGLIFLFNFFYLDGVEQQIDDIKQKQTSNLNAMDQQAQKMANLKKVENQIEEINQHFEKARNQFPDSIDINSLIEKLLSNHGVDSININKVNIKNVERKPYYNETPIQLTATGGYHGFGQFITHLANSEEMFTIESFVMKPRENNNGLMFNMQMKAYENNNRTIDASRYQEKNDSQKKEDKQSQGLEDRQMMDLL